MGIIKHHTIVVTGVESVIKEVHVAAVTLFGSFLVSPIMDSGLNDTCSFFIAPDGSNEGKKESNIYDNKREDFVEYLFTLDEKVKFIEASFGKLGNVPALENYN